MEIFQQIAPPRRQARASINKEAAWYTWSREFRSLFTPWNRQLRGLKQPKSTHLLGGKEYDDTYTLNINSLSNKKLARALMGFAKCLHDLKVSDRLMLFTNMLDQDLDGRSLRFLFAFFRSALVSLSHDPLSAVCQPLSRSRKGGTEFPLHSDLYVPVILFNVFEAVQADSSGASLFLPVSSVVQLLPQVKALPFETREMITKNLTGLHKEDRYEENYHLLHGWGHEWTADLERRMRQRQLRVKLYSGQGYMLHDRKWLHGREAINGMLSHKRLHRLIFNNREAQKAALLGTSTSIVNHAESVARATSASHARRPSARHEV